MYQHLKLSACKAAIYAALFSLLVTFPASAQIDASERWDTGKYEAWFLNFKRYTKSDVIAAQAKWRALEAEEAVDEWAGVYTPICDDCEVSLDKLRWTQKSGFLKFYVYTCLPELRALDFGSAVESLTTVYLFPEYPADSGRSPRPAMQYLKVKWGERHYLIAEDKVSEFCDWVAGVEVHSKNEVLGVKDFYLKDGDTEMPVTGLPSLPRGYEHLLKRPIEAKIIAIGKSYVERDEDAESCEKRTVIPVTLNVGSAKGVAVGMKFDSVAEDMSDKFIITSVGKHSSRAVSEQGWEPCEDSAEVQEEQSTDKDKYEPEIKVGLKLTTRPTNP